MFDRMLILIYRLRQMDIRKLKPWQIVVGIAGIIVAIWAIGVAISLLTTLLPLAVAILVVYFAYQWLSKHSDQIPESFKSKEEREVEVAVERVKAAKSGTPARLEDEEQVVAVEVKPTPAKEEVLVVKQVVNPQTGFKEPDISRLIEHEEKKLAEANKVTNDVMAQLEARKKRLQNTGGGS